MSIVNLIVFSFLLTLLSSVSLSDENKLKFRGLKNSEVLEPLQITISPDLLNIEKAIELKSNYKIAKEFAIKTDQVLKKNTKYRGSAAASSSKKIYDDYAGSVMFLYQIAKGKKGNESHSFGAGFLVDKSGVILTNWHVTTGSKEIFIWPYPEQGAVETEFLLENIDPFIGFVMVENKEQDLALVKVTGLKQNIELGNTNDVSVGDNVYAIGHPNGLPWSFTLGTVSQIRKNKKWNYEDKIEHSATVIQTQTPISPGNSGGPLFNEFGKVVGINTWGADGQNLNFAVAVDHAKEFIKANPNITKVNTSDLQIKKLYPNARTDDYNKNGIIDTWYIDNNKNGIIDLGYLDDDEDGFIEGTLIDEDEDGAWEIKMFDTDKNGKADQAYIDENGDGKMDALAIDYDQDGKWDKIEKLS